MKSILKRFAILFCLTLSVAVLAACHSNGTSTATTTKPTTVTDSNGNVVTTTEWLPPVEVDPTISAELSIMVPGGNTNEKTMINCLIDKFAEMYPNVEIEMTYCSVDNYVSAVSQQHLAGTLADIIWSNSPDFYDLLESEILEDLTPYIKSNNKKDTVATYKDADGNASKFDFKEDFYTEFFDMGSAGGKYYVIPRSCDSVITFLNTDILTKAGVDLNPETTLVKNGWTWDDFLAVCAQVRTYMDSHGMASSYVIDANLSSWLSVCFPLLRSFGAEVIDVNGNNVIDSEATKLCVQMIREMVEKRYINDSTVATTGSFDSGNSAMLFQSASVSLYADRKALSGKVDLVSFPLVMDNNTPFIGAGIAGYGITKASKNKDVAWLFLSYLLSYEGQQLMANNGLNLASIRKDLSDYTVANWGGKYKDLNLSAYTYGSEYKISTDFFVRTKLSAKAGIQQAIIQLMINATNKEKDIDKAIRTCKKDIDDALIDY